MELGYIQLHRIRRRDISFEQMRNQQFPCPIWRGLLHRSPSALADGINFDNHLNGLFCAHHSLAGFRGKEVIAILPGNGFVLFLSGFRNKPSLGRMPSVRPSNHPQPSAPPKTTPEVTSSVPSAGEGTFATASCRREEASIRSRASSLGDREGQKGYEGDGTKRYQMCHVMLPRDVQRDMHLTIEEDSEADVSQVCSPYLCSGEGTGPAPTDTSSVFRSQLDPTTPT